MSATRNALHGLKSQLSQLRRKMVQRRTRESVERKRRRDFDQFAPELRTSSRASESAFLRDGICRLHFLDRPDAGNGLLRKGESQSDGAHQPPINVHRAAAHALNHTGGVERSARQPGQDYGLLGAEILQHAQYLDLKLLDPIAHKYSFSHAALSHPDVFERENGGLGTEGRCYNRQEDQKTQNGHKPYSSPPKRAGTTKGSFYYAPPRWVRSLILFRGTIATPRRPPYRGRRWLGSGRYCFCVMLRCSIAWPHSGTTTKTWGMASSCPSSPDTLSGGAAPLLPRSSRRRITGGSWWFCGAPFSSCWARSALNYFSPVRHF